MQVLRWTHPDFDNPIVLLPETDIKRYLGDADPAHLKSEPIEMPPEAFEALPEWEG